MYFGVSQLHVLLFSSLEQKYPNPPRSEEAWIPPSVVSKETSSVPLLRYGSICTPPIPLSQHYTPLPLAAALRVELSFSIVQTQLWPCSWCECMSCGMGASVSQAQLRVGFFPKSQGSWWDWILGK